VPDSRATIRSEIEELHRRGQRLHLMLLMQVEPAAYLKLRGEFAKPAKRSPEGSAKAKLLPDRYLEFRELHRLDKSPKTLDPTTYTISDFIQGIVVRDGLGQTKFAPGRVAATKVQSQVDILGSATERLDSSLTDITGVIEADLMDNELSSARELVKAKYLRSGGIVAGVVLERHLKRLIDNHGVTFRKQAQIAALNDALKKAKVYDVPQWRQIQRLGDLRNLCGHHGDREPTGEEVEELLLGVAKVTTTVF
jgi:hypothetical protein